MSAQTILSALECDRPRCSCHPSARAGKGNTHCVSHEDPTPSLTITEKDGKVLWNCKSGCTQEAVQDALKAKGLLESVLVKEIEPASGYIAATYDYFDRAGSNVFQVVRYAPKDFRQRRLEGDQWVWNLEGVTRVLYNLPAVVRAVEKGETIFIVEGEKDADALSVTFGLCATTSPGGAGKWDDAYVMDLVNADVVIIADKDDPGRKHAREVATSCGLAAKSIKVIELPGDVKDASDWIAAGGGKEDLLALVEKTPVWNNDGRRILTGRDLRSMYDDVMAKRMAGDPEYVGISTGLAALDDQHIALHAGDLVLVVASTGVGKSALLTTLQLSLDKREIASLFLSLEMSWVVIADRMLSTGMTMQQLEDRPGLLVDDPSLTTAQIETLVKVAKLRGARVVFIDYAQRIVGDRKDSEYERVSQISNDLARIARDTRVCIVAAAQVSRQGAKRDGSAPQLSEIRASGHLEQDASIVLSLGRKSGETSTMVAIQKNRYGGTGFVTLTFDAERARFISTVRPSVPATERADRRTAPEN